MTALPGVGPKRAATLAEAGCRTVGELLLRVPARYEDRSAPTRAAAVTGEGEVTLVGRLRKVATIRLRGRGAMVRAELLDGSGALPVVWFNRPHLAKGLLADGEYLLHGKARIGRGGKPELLNPSCERVSPAMATARWAPVYRALAPGLGPARLRELAQRALAELAATERERPIDDPLPEPLLHRHGLPPLLEALRFLHAPPDETEAERLLGRATPAHRRVIYGELLALQLRLARARQRARQPKAHRYVPASDSEAPRLSFPFALTAAQERVSREILADLGAPTPMRRLLQGDVGSGKTAVAVLALAEALAAGHQAAFMAPTELLAEQHFVVLRRLLPELWPVTLLTGSTPAADAVRSRLRVGEAGLVVGTHALFQASVELPRLALVVIDEQQRFGVGQREALLGKGRRADLLVMTATPIPRSLALTAYGDLDLSLLDELPPGRLPVATEVLAARRRPDVLAILRAALDTGQRAYVVYPLIEASARVAASALEREGEELRSSLAAEPDPVPTAVLHGRQSAEERSRRVRAFASGEVRVLLSTTVIEVGIDVPEATWMVIESAERFGLAQLHQLRGRVGRGHQPGRCVALHGRLSEEARRRLEVFARTTDGFEIAEADLAIRGPGDLAGTRQAGMAALAVADPVADADWLELAKHDAAELLATLGEARIDGFL